MMRIWIAIRMTIVLTLLTGIAYPLAMAGLAHTIFPRQAEGSLVFHGRRAVGSTLIGQNFSAPRYFHGRPSAAGAKGYDAASSGASNLGPTNKALIEAVRSRAKVLRETEPGLQSGAIPADMVTSSGSGLDPDISPASAYAQAARIADARGLAQKRVRALIRDNIQGRFMGVFGEPRVDVLELNLALDALGTGHSSNAPRIKDMARR
jgi:K+-transporting ATPase ATPase C chain